MVAEALEVALDGNRCVEAVAVGAVASTGAVAIVLEDLGSPEAGVEDLALVLKLG